ncbi:MAG: NAD(P)/FAD-dependent oxidoreductase [Bryobacteraceae bacterium]
MNLHRVALIGCGFGGLYAAKALKRAPVELTVFDRRNFHLFQPLLYQVATGALSPGEIASPIRVILRDRKNTRVLLEEVRDLDADAHQLLFSDGRRFDYDTLIVATGSTHSYFDHPEWEELAPGLKTIENATEIRRRILRAFEAAEIETDPAKRTAWLTFVVIGAGPTGVELAGALGEIANDTLRHDFRSINPAEAQILLLEGADRVLPSYPPDLSAAAEKSLIDLSVRTRTHCRVTAIDPGFVTVQYAERTDRIAAQTVLWAAGVRASGLGKMLAERAGAKLDKAGRVIVEPDLTIAGHPEILVIGDLATFTHQTGQPLPGVAPVAMQEGRYAAGLIRKRLRNEPSKPFHYWDKGSMATIGRAAAVAEMGKIHFSGLLAWLAWLFIHLMYLVGFDNRLLVLMKWFLNYLTRNRGARLITGGK